MCEKRHDVLLCPHGPFQQAFVLGRGMFEASCDRMHRRIRGIDLGVASTGGFKHGQGSSLGIKQHRCCRQVELAQGSVLLLEEIQQMLRARMDKAQSFFSCIFSICS